MGIKIVLDKGVEAVPSGALEEEAPVQAQISLKMTKTLDGNLLIDDHKYMDILVMPESQRIVTLPKPYAEKDVYHYQQSLMYSLFKGGITNAMSPEGGPVFGMVETTYPAQGEVNTLEAVLYQINEFITQTAEDERISDEYDENVEDRFTDPTPEDSTAYGSIPPYQDTPGANAIGDPTYTFAGYGYLY